MEAKSINFDGGLETNAQVVVVHLVELGARVQQADVAGDCEEEVVVERWELRKLILEHLWCGFGTLALALDSGLDLFRKDFIGELS